MDRRQSPDPAARRSGGSPPSGPVATALFWVVAACLAAGLGAQALEVFKPPRAAVVDISAVFEGYDKRRDRQAQLQAQLDEVTNKLKDLEKRYKDLQSEIQLVQKGTELYTKKLLELKQLEVEVETLRDSAGKSLKNTMREFLEEIRAEITAEIAAFAEAQDLDIVFEKTVTAEANSGGASFRWPIVHYARPTLDVTQEIVRRLNEKYSGAGKR